MLYRGVIKLVGGVRLKKLTTARRLKLTLSGGIKRCVEGCEYVCLYVRYVYSEIILKYIPYFNANILKSNVIANTFSDKGEGG